ncbi:hypothetical protein SAMN04488516_10668 [Desulfonauticus submarinus]|uniref:Uncharacterized protein n=1 Tax=Desulfonauticus submarinus TaxID=206665 RepID=A0A1H0DZ66_9BACT|nr:hypothetical protein [Desulfonauticus submarinus]SDN75547.1 hypothetical protein SAMN04488516_10668 [Desulfonauticus submarinus]
MCIKIKSSISSTDKKEELKRFIFKSFKEMGLQLTKDKEQGIFLERKHNKLIE